jgi:hypothetical protein
MEQSTSKEVAPQKEEKREKVVVSDTFFSQKEKVVPQKQENTVEKIWKGLAEEGVPYRYGHE